MDTRTDLVIDMDIDISSVGILSLSYHGMQGIPCLMRCITTEPGSEETAFLAYELVAMSP